MSAPRDDQVRTNHAEVNIRRPALRHDGPCGPRVECWRVACRTAWPGYRTVEYVAGRWLARCHGIAYDDLGRRADEHRAGEAVA